MSSSGEFLDYSAPPGSPSASAGFYKQQVSSQIPGAWAWVASGGLTFGGIAAAVGSHQWIYASTGGMVLDGTGRTRYHAFGAPFAFDPWIGSGGLLFGGAAICLSVPFLDEHGVWSNYTRHRKRIQLQLPLELMVDYDYEGTGAIGEYGGAAICRLVSVALPRSRRVISRGSWTVAHGGRANCELHPVQLFAFVTEARLPRWHGNASSCIQSKVPAQMGHRDVETDNLAALADAIAMLNQRFDVLREHQASPPIVADSYVMRLRLSSIEGGARTEFIQGATEHGQLPHVGEGGQQDGGDPDLRRHRGRVVRGDFSQAVRRGSQGAR